MKTPILSFGLTLGLCALSQVSLATPTWDLPAISRAKFEKVDPTNPELLKDPLAFAKEPPQIWDGKTDSVCTDARVAAAMVAEREDGLFSMKSPGALMKLDGINAANLHNFAGMKFVLPDDRGGEYRATLRYRANHPHQGFGTAYYSNYIIILGGGKEIGRRNIPDSGEDSDYWWRREFTFKVPAGVRELKIQFRFDGVGYCKFTGLSVKRAIAEKEPDVSFCVKPYSWIDDRFAVEAGKIGVLDVCWKCRKGLNISWWKDGVTFVVPKGFEFVGSSLKEEVPRFTREKLADGSERITLPMMDRQRPWFGGYHDDFGLGVMVRATGPVGTEGRMTFRAIVGGKPLGDEGSITLSTVEPFRAVQPKRYRAVAMLTYQFQNFRGKTEASAAYADYLREKGVTWIMPNTPWLVADRTLVPMWRSKGFDMITPTDHEYLMNAYKIRGTGERPAADKFVARPGINPGWDFPLSACPASIYEERPYFVTNIVPHLAARSAGTDGQWVNWEPFYFRGCYCDYCKKLGAEWMEKTGDRNIEHFHSYQHGLLAKTVHKWMMKSFATDRAGLMPAIAWCEVGSHGRLCDYPQDKLAKDYIGEMKWIPAWGPYIGWSPSDGAYNGIGGRLSAYFFAAKDVREELDRNYPDAVKRPKLMGQPAGPNWVIQPEWLEISMDAFFFNRWEAIAPWIFPQGADARHWKAYANAVTRAAKYENAVWDGTRNDAATTLVCKPGSEAKCAWPDKTFLTKVRDVDLIQQTTYDYRGVRYVAVFNLNDLRGAVFTLKTTGLAAGDYAVVAEDGTVARPRVTAEELAAKGVELSLPESRCRVFEIRPAK